MTPADLRAEDPRKNTQARIASMFGVARQTVAHWLGADYCIANVGNPVDPPAAPTPKTDGRVKYTAEQKAEGLRRTNADKRRAVETLLRDPEWSTWSDRRIAEVCGVSNTFVSAQRPQVSTDDTSPASPTRTGRDGKQQPATKLERASATARRKAIYLALHPETKHGGAPGAGRGKAPKVAESATLGTPSFVADAAAKTGRAPRTIREDVQIGEGLTEAPSKLRRPVSGEQGLLFSRTAPGGTGGGRALWRDRPARRGLYTVRRAPSHPKRILDPQACMKHANLVDPSQRALYR